MTVEGEPPHADAPAAPRWGIGDVVLGFFAGFVLSSLMADLWVNASGDHRLSLGGKALAQLGLWAGLLGTVTLASRWKGAGTLRRDFGLHVRPVDLLLGTAVGTAAHRLLVPAVALLMRPVVGKPDVSGPAEELFESAHGVAVVGLVLFVVVGAPIVEELFFRGLLLRSLQRRMTTGWAVAVTGVVFGLAHPQALALSGLVLLMVSLAAFGVVLAALAVRTGRLGPCIVAHAAFNAWTAAFLLTR